MWSRGAGGSDHNAMNNHQHHQHRHPHYGHHTAATAHSYHRHDENTSDVSEDNRDTVQQPPNAHLTASALAAYTLDASANASAFANAYDTSAAPATAGHYYYGNPPAAWDGGGLVNTAAAQLEAMREAEQRRSHLLSSAAVPPFDSQEHHRHHHHRQHLQRMAEAAAARERVAYEAELALAAAAAERQALLEEHQERQQAARAYVPFNYPESGDDNDHEDIFQQQQQFIPPVHQYPHTVMHNIAQNDSDMGAATPRIEILEERRHDTPPHLTSRKRTANASALDRDSDDDDDHSDEKTTAFQTATVPPVSNPPAPSEDSDSDDSSQSEPHPILPQNLPPPSPVVKKEPTQQKSAPNVTPTTNKKKKNTESNKEGLPEAAAFTTPPKKKKKTTTPGTTPSSFKKTESKSSHKSSSKSGSKKSPINSAGGNPPRQKSLPTALTLGTVPSMYDPAPGMTSAEYQNLDALMTQFCRVPLLAEFSRPISLLHPELMSVYSKVVDTPMDLGKVCRSIRRRQYKNARAVRVDMWRIFANCVKYHTHPLTRDNAFPSFISISLHLRDYFNALWQEFMLPSDCPNPLLGKQAARDPAAILLKIAHEKRDKNRKERLNVIVNTVLSAKCIEISATAMEYFIDSGGRVDGLDVHSIARIDENDFEEDENSTKRKENTTFNVELVFRPLKQLLTKLREIAGTSQEYTVDEFHRDLKSCYEQEELTDTPTIRKKIADRLDRLLGKIIVPIHEANCRGVDQSSVWGCMAAAIWARESTKRPYWPALVLGILAPDDQREDWHKALTDRNEARLPDKLRLELQSGKRKAEQALRRQSTGNAERMSFFLVEFLGTHEFIWVREADIVENFDPENFDPNVQVAAGNCTKKKKVVLRGQTPANAKLIQKAVEEGRWALEEFELLLNDPCGDMAEEGDDEEENYTYPVLCESDEEADRTYGSRIVPTDAGENTDTDDDQGVSDTKPYGKLTDLEEMNELLATDGLLDYSAEGRKNAKRRAAALKKQQADAKREALRKDKEDKAKQAAKKKKEETIAKKKKDDTAAVKGKEKEKEKFKTKEKVKEKSKAKTKDLQKLERDRLLESTREQKELEKRRKKRERERERVMRENERKTKLRKEPTSDASLSPKRGSSSGVKRIPNKRERAEAIIRGYLTRIAMSDEMKGLGLGGVLTLPAAGVESSGLLGMALSFRAAAGEIEMPNSNDNSLGFQPWDRIDVDGPPTSAERCANLEKQIEMMKAAIEKFDRDDSRRLELIKLAREQKEEKEKAILQAEKAAKKSDIPKKKKWVKKKKLEGANDLAKRKDGNYKTENNKENKANERNAAATTSVENSEEEGETDDDDDSDEEDESTCDRGNAEYGAHPRDEDDDNDDDDDEDESDNDSNQEDEEDNDSDDDDNDDSEEEMAKSNVYNDNDSGSSDDDSEGQFSDADEDKTIRR